MCNLSEMLFEKGFEQGFEYGYAEVIMIRQMLEMGRTPEAIADFCKFPMSTILEVKMDMEEILQIVQSAKKEPFQNSISSI